MSADMREEVAKALAKHVTINHYDRGDFVSRYGCMCGWYGFSDSEHRNHLADVLAPIWNELVEKAMLVGHVEGYTAGLLQKKEES